METKTEKIFDVEEYIKRATSFHEDKDRAEKLSTKVGYLNSLCSTLEEKIFFRAVYEELFPDDKVTIDLLDRLINGAFKEEKDEWMFQEIDTVEELDTFSKNLKKRVKSIIKQLQRHQLAQIERMRRKNREIREKEEKLIQERDEKYNVNVKEMVDTDRLLYDLKRMSVEDRRRLFAQLGDNPKAVIQEKDLYGIKGLTDIQKKRLIGKTIEQLTPEIRRELGIDALFSELAPTPHHHRRRDMHEFAERMNRPSRRLAREMNEREFEVQKQENPTPRKNLNKIPHGRHRQEFLDAYKEMNKNGPILDGPPQLGKW